MAYADYGYYSADYLCGRDPFIPEGEFPFWEKQARRKIDLATFDRIPGLEEIPEAAKDCACELAELLYKADVIDRESVKNGASGPMASYSNDGQSATFDLARSSYTGEGKEKEADRIIRKYLLDTGLMFKGVYGDES